MAIYSPSGKPIRSTLLTILCVLSFVGGGYRIVSGIFAYAMAPKMTTVQQEFEKNREELNREIDKEDDADKRGKDMAKKFMKEAETFLSPDAMRKNALISIITALITVAGAFMMFNLNKTGYWVYIAGCLAEIVLPIMVFGGGMLMGFSAAVNGIIALLFIILYGMTLKEMKSPDDIRNDDGFIH